MNNRNIYIIVLFTSLILSIFSIFSSKLILARLFLLLTSFYCFGKIFNIKFKLIHYLFFFIIILLGTSFNFFYYTSFHYDKILHFFMPLLASEIIFFFTQKFIRKKWLRYLFTFFSLVSFLVFLEIYEYLIDIIFGATLQGVFENNMILMSRIDDTMQDLILGVSAATLFIPLRILITRIKLSRS